MQQTYRTPLFSFVGLIAVLTMETLCSTVNATDPTFQGKVLFSGTWGGEFRIASAENGDSIALGGVFADNTFIYFYDLLDGRVVAFDSSGVVKKRTTLESIGRTTYFGDDFVVHGSLILFLNSIDQRVEIFLSASGHHTGNFIFPADLPNKEQKRSLQLVNRIFLNGAGILVGNEFRVFVFDEGLSRQIDKPIVAANGESIEALDRNRILTRSGDRLFIDGVGGGRAIPTHFQIPGKRYFFFHHMLYALTMDHIGWRIVHVHL